MSISITELRANIYRLLDEILVTGTPLEIERKGQVLRISPKIKTPKKRGKRPKLAGKLATLARLSDERGDGESSIVGDPEDLVHVDWSDGWAGVLPE